MGIILLAAAPLLAGLRPHPRVEVDAELIAKVRELRKAGDPAWARFDRWTNTSPEKGSDTNRIVACMFHYLVSNEEGKFNCAWQPVQSKIYRNGTDRSGGLMALLDLYNGDKHTAAYQGGVLVAIIARVYDWGYGRLSPEQRLDVVEWLNDAVAFLHLDNDDGLLYLRNDGASVTQGVAAATYATLGENPKGEQLMAWFRERWSETLKGLDIMGKGGATGEGNAYGTSPTGSGIITAANVAYTATGEDLFLSHVWFRQRLLYDAFAAYPGTLGGPGMPTGVPREPMIEQASIAGDGRRAVS